MIDLTQGKLCTKEQSAGLVAAPVSNEHVHPTSQPLLNAIAPDVPSDVATPAPARDIDLRFEPSRQLRRLLTVSLSRGGYVYLHAFVKGRPLVQSIAFASARLSDCYVYVLRGDYNLWCDGSVFSLVKREADELVAKLGIRVEVR